MEVDPKGFVPGSLSVRAPSSVGGRRRGETAGWTRAFRETTPMAQRRIILGRTAVLSALTISILSGRVAPADDKPAARPADAKRAVEPLVRTLPAEVVSLL